MHSPHGARAGIQARLSTLCWGLDSERSGLALPSPHLKSSVGRLTHPQTGILWGGQGWHIGSLKVLPSLILGSERASRKPWTVRLNPHPQGNRQSEQADSEQVMSGMKE